MGVLQTPRSQTSRHDYPPQRRKPHKKISRFPDKTQKSSQSLHFCPDIRKSSYHPLSEFRLKGYFRFRSLFIRISAYVKSASGQGPEREILVQNFEEPAVYPWFTPSSTSGFPSISDRKSLPFPCFFTLFSTRQISWIRCPTVDIKKSKFTPRGSPPELGCFTHSRTRGFHYSANIDNSFTLSCNSVLLRKFA